MTFAPNKTQAMVVSRSRAAGTAVEGRTYFDGVLLPLLEMDRGLKFDRDIRHITQKASHRMSGLRKIKDSESP